MSASPTSASSLSSAPTKRACDNCHRRKVKCIVAGEEGVSPCKNCYAAGLKCTYNAIPQKKGPKGSRAKVISELRESQRHSPSDITSSPISPLLGNPSQHLPLELIEHCTNFFFANLYPTQPILRRQDVTEMVASMHESTEATCLIGALCAYMMIQPNMHLPPSLDLDAFSDSIAVSERGIMVLQDTIVARKQIDYVKNATVYSVITSFFLFGCYFCLNEHDQALYRLRETTTLALVTGMHREDTYQQLTNEQAVVRRRLFWLLFVTERAYAIQTRHPLSLQSTIELPMAHTAEESISITGFNHLIRLYKPFDNNFVGFWSHQSHGITADWIVALQRQLTIALPQYLQCTESQMVDLKVSHAWLRLMVWQLAVSYRLITSIPTDQTLSYRYPVEISRELIQQAPRFTQSAMEVHGIGLVSKLFDIACTLADIIECVPMQYDGFSLGPRDYLLHYIELISKLPGSENRYIPHLVQKSNATIPVSPVSNMGQTLPSSNHVVFKAETYEHSSIASFEQGSAHDDLSDMLDSGPQFNIFHDTLAAQHTTNQIHFPPSTSS